MEKLNRHPLYCYLTEAELTQICSARSTHEFAPGERLISIGDRNRDILCLEEGRVSVQVEDLNGILHEVAQYSSGCLVGEMNFVIPTRRTANVVAITQVRVDVLSYDQICPLLKENYLLAYKIFAALNMQLRTKYLSMMES